MFFVKPFFFGIDRKIFFRLCIYCTCVLLSKKRILLLSRVQWLFSLSIPSKVRSYSNNNGCKNRVLVTVVKIKTLISMAIAFKYQFCIPVVLRIVYTPRKTLTRIKSAPSYCVLLGHDTKAMLNNSGTRYKRSRLEKDINKDVLGCVVILIILCLAGAIGKCLFILLTITDELYNVCLLYTSPSPRDS